MNEEYKPSAYFVSRVMTQVHAYEAAQPTLAKWFSLHPVIRYLLAGGGTLFGIFRAIPVF